MLQFSEHFFEDEYRSDFLVESTMKSVWAAELEVLYRIAAVCEKYQLPWYAGYGTLLGAVRHKGFIPWDDDIDIYMFREDYEALLEVLSKELPEEWVVYNSRCGEKQTEFWTCVMNSQSVSMEKQRLQEFHNCPFIVGVDIFPLDYLPAAEEEADLEKALFNLIKGAVIYLKKKERSPEENAEFSDMLNGISEYLQVQIDKDGDMLTQLLTLANDLCIAYGANGSDRLVCYWYYAEKERLVYQIQQFEDTLYVPFESVFMPIPVGFDEILKTEYGDYMKFEKNLQEHEYPFYKKQLNELRKIHESVKSMM